MNEKQYIKWYSELNNQEYKDSRVLDANIKLMEDGKWIL